MGFRRRFRGPRGPGKKGHRYPEGPCLELFAFLPHIFAVFISRGSSRLSVTASCSNPCSLRRRRLWNRKRERGTRGETARYKTQIQADLSCPERSGIDSNFASSRRPTLLDDSRTRGNRSGRSRHPSTFARKINNELAPARKYSPCALIGNRSPTSRVVSSSYERCFDEFRFQ